MKNQTKFALIPLLLFANGATAQNVPAPKRFYAGVDVGQSKTPSAEYLWGSIEGRHDGEATAYRVRFGYQFIRYLAIEGSYYDLGEASTNNVVITCPQFEDLPCPASLSYRARVSGLSAVAVGTLPIGKHFNLRANFGWALQALETRTTFVGLPNDETRARKMSPQWGVGIGVPVNESFEVTADWNRYVGFECKGLYERVPPGGIADAPNTDAIYLGARYKF